MQVPSSIAHIEDMIVNEVQESISLDYKRSLAIAKERRHEIARDVTAFANSAGGMIIYGVREEDHLPIEIDGGVEHGIYTREWLENVILGHVSPRLAGTRIHQIPLNDTHSVFVVQVAATLRGPHQVSGEGRYYRRFNFSSVPMEHYEVEDVWARFSRVPPLMAVDIALDGTQMAYVRVRNVGDSPAQEVRFVFDQGFKWPREGGLPRVFAEGATSFPPDREMRFFYATFPEISKEEAIASRFDVVVRYRHAARGSEVEDVFHLDFNDYFEAALVQSQSARAVKDVEMAIKALDGHVNQAVKHLEHLAKISDETGLAVSHTALKNLSHVTRGDDEFVKIVAERADRGVFMEVLGIDLGTAHRLWLCFHGREEQSKIKELEGMTDERWELLKKHFVSLEGRF